MIFFSRTGALAITGENAKTFANLVCSESGFSLAEFIGVKDEYNEFIRDKGLLKSVDRNQDICIPTYEVSGANCLKAKNLKQVKA